MVATDPRQESSSSAEAIEQDLRESRKIVLVVDLVESVRLMAAHERSVINHYLGFVKHVTEEILPRHWGRLVKSFGDGLMAEFDRASDGVHAAMAMQRYFDPINAALPPDQQLRLRAGINSTRVYEGATDIYGSGVNLAARVANLAGPGEIMVTSEVRDELADGLDCQLEDMGECYLKHVSDPVRTYRVGATGPGPILTPYVEYATRLNPTIAIVPLAAASPDPAYLAIGELIADGVIAQLCRTKELRLISRLSTSAFRQRDASASEIGAHLGADYIVSGRYVPIESGGHRFLVTVELADARTHQIVGSDRLIAVTDDLLEKESESCHRIADMVHQSVLDSAAQMALTQPLPTLASYALLLAGINMMHRSAGKEFERSRVILEALAERHRRSAMTHSWLAEWYVLSSTRGGVHDKPAAIEALSHTHAALDVEPSNSTARAMEGFVQLHLFDDLPAALKSLDAAVESNSSDALAWLFRGVAYTFFDHPDEAMQSSERALLLAPLDPLRYYFESLAASSALCAGNYVRAIDLCAQSLKRNRAHAHTYRALITAYWLGGNEELARSTAQMLMALAPDTTISKFRANSASAKVRFGKMIAECMLHAGIPS